jgi:hypothetical protein
MTINDQGSRGVAVTSADRIGKVFVVEGQDERRCLICDGVFTRQGAAEHARTACYFPDAQNNGRISAEANQSCQHQQSPKLS